MDSLITALVLLVVSALATWMTKWKAGAPPDPATYFGARVGSADHDDHHCRVRWPGQPVGRKNRSRRLLEGQSPRRPISLRRHNAASAHAIATARGQTPAPADTAHAAHGHPARVDPAGSQAGSLTAQADAFARGGGRQYRSLRGTNGSVDAVERSLRTRQPSSTRASPLILNRVPGQRVLATNAHDAARRLSRKVRRGRWFRLNVQERPCRAAGGPRLDNSRAAPVLGGNVTA